MAPDQPIQVEGENQKQLDRELRDMLSALTNRLTQLQRTNTTKSGSSQPHAADEKEDDDDAGPQVITLAGSNTGATMRTGWDETSQPYSLPWGEQDEMSAYVNSNFQAINNSLMLGGSYNSNDPGVHLDINDYIQPHPDHEEKHKDKKKADKKEKKKIASGSAKSPDDHSD